jgi:ATP-dependent Lhr-like helicase
VFSPATRDWFAGAFAAPTPAQEGAWRATAAGEHALVVAPTGSGDTFPLGSTSWKIVDITHDRVIARPVPGEPAQMPF